MHQATPPKRFFDTHEQAKAEKQFLIQKENFNTDELHILPVYKAV